ncbi:hypothetical protein [Catellatospora methionotrophica]|uniref:hypothetical protein n=1 Tax=Catellatospora methionotrophica TaxID=121620 RepID=UPI00340AE164
MSGERTVLYWDPMPQVDAVIGSFPRDRWWQSREQTFHGKWEERNWRNVPGPFYGAMTDNCWVGRLHAPRHMLYGDDTEYEQEFLYRQPQTAQELRDVIVAMQADPWAGWACDGDAHWTPELVREWWRERALLRDWITAKSRRWSVSDRADEREAAHGLADYLAYVDGGLAADLQAYMYFLDNGVGPTLVDRLPSL